MTQPKPKPQAKPKPQCYCAHNKYQHPAAFCIAWRSDSMTAPAFDYLCPQGFALRPKTDRVSEDVRILDDLEGFLAEDLDHALQAARVGTRESVDASFQNLAAAGYFRVCETSGDITYDLCVLLIDVRNVAAQLKGK